MRTKQEGRILIMAKEYEDAQQRNNVYIERLQLKYKREISALEIKLRSEIEDQRAEVQSTITTWQKIVQEREIVVREECAEELRQV